MRLKNIIENGERKGLGKKDITTELERKGYSSEEIEDAFRKEGVKKVIGGGSEGINYFEKIKLLFSNPSVFFDSLKGEGIGPAFIMYFVVGAISLLVGNVFSYFGSVFFFGKSSIFISGFSFLFSLVLFAVGIGLTFVYSGISHLVILMFKGDGGFVRTYNAVVYSLVPFLIFSIVPYIGWLSIIYSVVLLTIGLSSYHNISKGKAVVAALVPVILTVLIIGLIILFIYFYLYSSFGF